MPEILPHPKRGTMEIGSERIMPVFGSIRAAEGASDENPVVTIIGTDGSEDRHGSVINPRGWLTASYLRNPKVLWSHGVDEGKPALGETVALRSVGGAWEFDIKFALGPWRNIQDNLAQFWWEWYRDFGGTLASSVAFLPKKWIDRTAKEMPTFFAENVEYIEQELTEISFVNVPSNRNAVTEAVARARSAGKLTEGLASMLGYSVSPIVIRSQPEERMPVPKTTDEKPLVETQAVEPVVDDKVPAPEKRAAALPSLSAEILSKRANGEELTEVEKGEVEVFAKALHALGFLAPEVDKDAPASTFRAAIKQSVTALRCGDYWDDCYTPTEYCPLCWAKLGTCNDAEDVSPEDATAEQATIAAMIAVKTQQLTDALAGWSSAEHDALRQFCSDNVYNAMWQIERLWTMAEFWYDDMIPAAEMPEGMPRMLRKFTEAIVKDPKALQRAGAEFSTKNKTALQEVHDHATAIATSISTMLSTSADDTTTEKSVGDSPQVFRITGLPSPGRDEDAGQRTVLLSVADDSGAGTGDRSTQQAPPSLYDAKALPVRS